MRSSKSLTREALDRRLTEEARMLQRPIQARDLWNRIETALRAESEAPSRPAAERGHSRRRTTGFRFRFLMIPAAAGAALLLALAVLPPKPAPTGSGLLDKRALARVDAQEKEYVQAIDDLEKRARPRISALDLSLMSLYRDRLSVIDAQIGKCREALDRNPSNAHIRRYLLAALRDKKQTLAELLGS
jgi:hypothetical protein